MSDSSHHNGHMLKADGIQTQNAFLPECGVSLFGTFWNY